MAALEESLAAIKGEELSGDGEARSRSRSRSASPPAKSKSTAKPTRRRRASRRQRPRSRDRRPRLSITNLDKVLYPKAGFTKGEVIDYYARIAPALLPHLRDRPLTLVRFPDGVEGKRFFEKHAPATGPTGCGRSPIEVGSRGGDIEFVVCDDLPTLVWLAQLAAIELHPSLALGGGRRAADACSPSTSTRASRRRSSSAARSACGCATCSPTSASSAFPKTSGSKGMQVYVPLNGELTYDDDEALSPTPWPRRSRTPTPTSSPRR